ncbi:unnamed protein product, partial [Amoebophrya sp. A25]|eukprot:GSA25T00026538001.1
MSQEDAALFASVELTQIAQAEKKLNGPDCSIKSWLSRSSLHDHDSPFGSIQKAAVVRRRQNHMAEIAKASGERLTRRKNRKQGGDEAPSSVSPSTVSPSSPGNSPSGHRLSEDASKCSTVVAQHPKHHDAESLRKMVNRLYTPRKPPEDTTRSSAPTWSSPTSKISSAEADDGTKKKKKKNTF